jgi:hypothetical protein
MSPRNKRSHRPRVQSSLLLVRDPLVPHRGLPCYDREHNRRLFEIIGFHGICEVGIRVSRPRVVIAKIFDDLINAPHRYRTRPRLANRHCTSDTSDTNTMADFQRHL